MKVNLKICEFQRNEKCPVNPNTNQQKKIVMFKFYPLDLKHRIDHRFNKFSFWDYVSKDAPSSDFFEDGEVYLWYWPKT